MLNSKCDRGIRFLACCKEETKTEFGVRKRKTEQEDDSGRVILETRKKKKEKEREKTDNCGYGIWLAGVVTIKATLCYCPENVNTAVLINSCTALRLSQ